MKFFFIILSIITSKLWANENIFGTWKFTEYNYDGQTLPAPNPNLDLRFSFNEKGISVLKWFRTDETGFCERSANYSIENSNYLYQKTIWLNPANDVSCSSDPEMRLGYETLTFFKIENHKLLLELALNGKPFTYILSFIDLN